MSNNTTVEPRKKETRVNGGNPDIQRVQIHKDRLNHGEMVAAYLCIPHRTLQQLAHGTHSSGRTIEFVEVTKNNLRFTHEAVMKYVEEGTRKHPERYDAR